MIKSSKNKDEVKEFKANGSKIRAALEWLIANCEDYKEITINEENLAQYPSDSNIELPSVEEVEEETGKKSKYVDINTTQQTNNEKHPFENDDEDFIKAYEEHIESLGDIPKPTHTVNENIATNTIDNCVKKAIEDLKVDNDQSEPEKIPWPEQGEEPVSDFIWGYFTKAFPHLFCDGKADISKDRPGVKPPMKQWLCHLLKVDRRFANDPQFILIVTNIMQKKKALALGNLYVDRCLEGTNLDEIKQKLQEGDEKTLRSLYCYTSNIEGSQQMFSQKISMAYSFLRDIRIRSNDTEMFNSFLTFSAADGQLNCMRNYLVLSNILEKE